VAALGGLTHPELRWNDGLKAIDGVYKKDLGQALEIYQSMCDDVLSTTWTKVSNPNPNPNSSCNCNPYLIVTPTLTITLTSISILIFDFFN
jgi:hypothetical protein